MRNKSKHLNTKIVRSSLSYNNTTKINIRKLICFLLLLIYLDNLENIRAFSYTFYTPKVYVVPCGETIVLSLECNCENCNIINIATLSFLDKKTGNFASVGHSIIHSHTPSQITQKSTIYSPTQILVTKDNNSFNTIIAKIDSNTICGTSYKNSNFGIYGRLSKECLANYSTLPPLELSSRYEIKKGPAILLSDILGKVDAFEIEIIQINILKTNGYECMLIQINDKRLIDNFGGIVRGMSGSPIIQNNKIIGVLSSMLVDDTSKGYALFADLMIDKLY